MELTKSFFEKIEPSPFGPPSTSGIYAVCLMNKGDKLLPIGRERIVYVGSAKNIKKRLSDPSHPYNICLSRFSGIYVYTKHFECSDYLSVERSLIQTYRPLLNKNLKNG